MKCVLVLCMLGLVAAASVETKNDPHPRGCIYIMGDCHKECPEGTHSYTTGCGYVTPEATCDDPKPKQGDDEICDYSECYCDAGTVRDTNTKKCVRLEDCSKNE